MINQEWIKGLFYQLVSVRSDSNSIYESVIEDALLNILSQHAYYQKNSTFYGAYPLKDDRYNRSVIWSLVKGEGKNTVILVNHHDAVDIVEYGKLMDYAFRPDDLKAALMKRVKNPAVLRDAHSDQWIFGRGTADMKAGLASQLGVVDVFTEKEKFDGNIVFLSVPDEETLSKGMLAAVELLDELKVKFDLEYELMINSEPYFNQVKDKAILYQGSVGKIMPVVYVRGVKSHIGDPFAGVNPSLILSELQRRTELNASLCDIQGFDASPPPVWINLKDRKKVYDASIPEAAVGYFNWLTFSRTPSEVLQTMKMIAKHALTDVLLRHQQAYDTFCMMNHEESEQLEYASLVLGFKDLYAQALEKGQETFQKEFKEVQLQIQAAFESGEIALPEAAINLIEYVAEYVDLEGPAVVVGLSGPYYPHITNDLIQDGHRYDLLNVVNQISKEAYGLEYQSNNYFMGISDLSYAGFVGSDADVEVLRENSPGWNEIYKVPFTALNKLSMPVVNIGPWGKDLHKITERVFGPDVFERIPYIICKVIETVFGQMDA